MKQHKRHFYILYRDEYVGQRWAVSEEEAEKNYWWTEIKRKDPFAERRLNPSDFEAIAH